VKSLGFRAQGLGLEFGAWSLQIRVQGLGCRVGGLGVIRVLSLKFKV
jgi:hypothetical protein